MHIISDLEGNLIQLGTFETDANSLVSIFSEIFNKKLIYTENEEICLKALNCNKFKLRIENNSIIDIIEVEDEKIQDIYPTIEERLTIVEDTINFMLGL